MAGELLTSEEVARMLGVSASSVKRWAEAGVLPCLKTPGRHRRFERDVVERFSAQTSPPGEPDPVVDRWLERLLDEPASLLALEAELLSERARTGAWWRVADLMGAVLEELGQRWRSGSVSVLEEHQATERLARALARCAERLATDSRAPRCLLATAEGDDHTLGLRLVELCLLEAGWSVLWAGRMAPLSEILDLVSARRAEMVAVSASAAQQDAATLDAEARALEAACRSARVVLLLGGRGPWPVDLTYAYRLEVFEELHELLERLPGKRHGR